MTTQTIHPPQPVKIPSGDKMIDVYLKQAVKKYGIPMKDFRSAEDVEVFLIKSVRTAKQVKMYASIEILMDGRCRNLFVTKVFR